MIHLPGKLHHMYVPALHIGIRTLGNAACRAIVHHRQHINLHHFFSNIVFFPSGGHEALPLHFVRAGPSTTVCNSSFENEAHSHHNSRIARRYKRL